MWRTHTLRNRGLHRLPGVRLRMETQDPRMRRSKAVIIDANLNFSRDGSARLSERSDWAGLASRRFQIVHPDPERQAVPQVICKCGNRRPPRASLFFSRAVAKSVAPALLGIPSPIEWAWEPLPGRLRTQPALWFSGDAAERPRRRLRLQATVLQGLADEADAKQCLCRR